ncbi:MAG: hypothetical protein ACAH80_09365 [Alphaproteobacteria bacterium]
MPPFISPQFAYHGRRGNQFFEHELTELLCPQPYYGEAALPRALALNTGYAVKKETGEYAYDLKKSEDGKTITLTAQLKQGDQKFETALTATQVKENLYEITALTFDNHVERLDSRWEITKVLGHIGRHQLQEACRDKLPAAHVESGKFGKFRRFLDRCLPDDPSVFTYYPPC